MPAIRQDQAILRLTKQVNDIWSALRRVTVNLPLFDIANQNTPNQLTGDQDNYVIGNYDLLRLSSSAAVSITGLRGGIKGRFLRIFNVGSYPITLTYQSASSSAINRFQFSNGLNAVIPPSSNITIYYDSVLERWIGGDTYSSGSIYMEVEKTNTQLIASGVSTKPNYGAVVSDQYNFFDTVNNQIEIQFDGSYGIESSGLWNGSGAGTYRAFAYYLNTNLLWYQEISPPSDRILTPFIRITKTFSAGDIIELFVGHDVGVDLDLLQVRTVLSRQA